MSATGGLYATFDVVFILLFGRSLLAALFGSKHLTPFGVIASIIRTEAFNKNLKKEYPGIDGEDPNKRAEATCNFLHDFVLDLKPVRKVQVPALEGKGTGKDGDQAKANDTGDKPSPSAEKTAVLTYDRTHSTDGSV
ncbi:hypothetical protein FS837_007505 [Tulasnella sp. UAMH 9824]|nr:hypothetical protein FS837_007505 [Tulasnella sp. UAMH 9824]